MNDIGEAEKTLFLTNAQDVSSNRDRTVRLKNDVRKINRESLDSNGHSLLITVCDYVFVSTVVLVNVVGFWRGLFGILSYFSEIHHLFFLFLTGSLIHFHFTACRKSYKRHLEKKTLCNFVLRRAYTYAFGSACVIQWAGLWFILDATSGLEVYPPLTYTIICTVILVCFRLLRNILAPPCTFCTDRLDEFFEFQTVFKTTPSKKGSSEISLYMLDCFFSVFVIGSLVVFVWRGVWCLTDIFLFPENDKISALVSLAIGYGLVIVIFSCQNLMERICEKLTGFRRIVIADIYVLVSFIGTINLWRGIWNLLNIYFLPEFPVWSCWITHLGSFLFLVLINCSNSILVRGVYMDGEDGGKCVVFPTFYLRLIFQEQRRRKMERSEVNHKISSLVNLSGDVEKDHKENSENSKVPIQKIETSEIKQ